MLSLELRPGIVQDPDYKIPLRVSFLFEYYSGQVSPREVEGILQNYLSNQVLGRTMDLVLSSAGNEVLRIRNGIVVHLGDFDSPEGIFMVPSDAVYWSNVINNIHPDNYPKYDLISWVFLHSISAPRILGRESVPRFDRILYEFERTYLRGPIRFIGGSWGVMRGRRFVPIESLGPTEQLLYWVLCFLRVLGTMTSGALYVEGLCPGLAKELMDQFDARGIRLIILSEPHCRSYQPDRSGSSGPIPDLRCQTAQGAA